LLVECSIELIFQNRLHDAHFNIYKFSLDNQKIYHLYVVIQICLFLYRTLHGLFCLFMKALHDHGEDLTLEEVNASALAQTMATS